MKTSGIGDRLKRLRDARSVDKVLVFGTSNGSVGASPRVHRELPEGSEDVDEEDAPKTRHITAARHWR